MNAPQALDRMGTAIMVALLIVGLGLFASGFLFVNPLDTAVRVVFGSIAVLGAACYLVSRYKRWRLARMVRRQLMDS